MADSISDTRQAELIAAGYGSIGDSLMDMERKRLLDINALSEPQTLTNQDLAALAGESLFPAPGYGVVAAGPMMTYQAGSNIATDLTTYTFSAMPIGTAEANRRVIICVGQRSTNPVVSSMTIGGVAATQDASVNSSFNEAEIWSAVVPTGTTADVVVTFAAAQARCLIEVYTIHNISSSSKTDSASGTGQGATANLITNVQAGDFVVVADMLYTTGAAGIVTTFDTGDNNITDDNETVELTQRALGSGHYTATGTTETPYGIGNIVNINVLCAAVYRPVA